MVWGARALTSRAGLAGIRRPSALGVPCSPASNQAGTCPLAGGAFVYGPAAGLCCRCWRIGSATSIGPGLLCLGMYANSGAAERMRLAET